MVPTGYFKRLQSKESTITACSPTNPNSLFRYNIYTQPNSPNHYVALHTLFPESWPYQPHYYQRSAPLLSEISFTIIRDQPHYYQISAPPLSEISPYYQNSARRGKNVFDHKTVKKTKNGYEQLESEQYQMCMKVNKCQKNIFFNFDVSVWQKLWISNW